MWRRGRPWSEFQRKTRIKGLTTETAPSIRTPELPRHRGCRFYFLKTISRQKRYPRSHDYSRHYEVRLKPAAARSLYVERISSDLSERWILMTQLIGTQPTTTDAVMGKPDPIAALALFSIVPDPGCDPDFEHLAGAIDDGAHRVVGHADCQRCGVRQAFGHALQLRAASGQTDSVFNHLARGLKRQVADDLVDGFNDYIERLFDSFHDVVAADAEAHRFARQEVSPLSQEQSLAFIIPRRADSPDDPFGFILEEQHAVSKGDHL